MAEQVSGASVSEGRINATAASLLGFLHDGPMTGWDLVATAEERIGAFWSITRSQVYRELATMARDGLVKADVPGPRDRRPYAITDDGRKCFAAWVEERVGEETTRFPLLLLVMFGRHVRPARVAEVVAEHRAMHAGRLAGYEQDLARGPRDRVPDPYARATLDFGLRYERAVLDWFDALPAEITGSDAAWNGRAGQAGRASS
jgi:DNA-binding PadR family transcriptional regulator